MRESSGSASRGRRPTSKENGRRGRKRRGREFPQSQGE